ncbi:MULTISPECIES: hypothetical protein [Microbacterium]|uniref:hypothetical protein n=1 Tax=Microbacterium TaxID=33882 RepID=UPI00146CE5AC|nr:MULTISPECIES: hypothetical protein [Microbacterium]
MDRDLPDGVIDADPPGGWDGVGDDETAARNQEAVDADQLLTGAPLRPDDPIEGEIARQSADPDLAADTDRGEEEP